jgi:hypothetical protein
MKKLLLLLTVALLISTTMEAQSTPSGYDGGSDLQKAILKTKDKKQTKPENPSTESKHIVTVTEILPPAHTKEEAKYYAFYNEESSSYLQKLMASEYWKRQVEIASQEELVNYNERVEKRKKDSIAQEDIRKQNVFAMEQIRKDTNAVLRKQDSINKISKERQLEEQRKQQKKNNSWNPLSR